MYSTGYFVRNEKERILHFYYITGTCTCSYVGLSLPLDPPRPPANFTILRVSPCKVSLHWLALSLSPPTTAPINDIILITRYCDTTSSCTPEIEQTFPLTVNRTILHLAPFKEYNFSLLSWNDLIGRGESRSVIHYSTLRAGAGK